MRVSRVHNYPLEYIIEALAPTTEMDFDLLPKAKQEIYRKIQIAHMHGSPDGPWFFIIARNKKYEREYQLLGITDTAMLRPQVFAVQNGEVQIGLVCSEKQAIDATLKSLAAEDPRFCTVADKYWNARGGSSSNGGSFIFSIKDDASSPTGKRLTCVDKFGNPVTPPEGQTHWNSANPLDPPFAKGDIRSVSSTHAKGKSNPLHPPLTKGDLSSVASARARGTRPVSSPPDKTGDRTVSSPPLAKGERGGLDTEIEKYLQANAPAKLAAATLKKLNTWDYDALRRFCADLVAQANAKDALREPAIATLTALIDTPCHTGAKEALLGAADPAHRTARDLRRAAAGGVHREEHRQAHRVEEPQEAAQAGCTGTFTLGTDLKSVPNGPSQPTLVINADGFEPELENRDSKLMIDSVGGKKRRKGAALRLRIKEPRLGYGGGRRCVVFFCALCGSPGFFSLSL